ncbi:MAG: GNAT family N-acetyltransferase [Chloroflexi bacterium]|nr:GNAT family N-acetyltransferase [Chloroflexota bacterium]
MTTNQPRLAPGLTLRVPQMSDVEAVAQLTYDVCAADGDATVATTAEDMRNLWQEPGFNLADDAWVVQAADGKIVGYEELYNRHGFAAFEGDGYVHPDFEGQGVGTSLLRALEARALVSMAQAEPDLKVFIRNGFSTNDARAIELHQNEGYAPIRYTWRMEIKMDAPPPPPVWPRGVVLRPFQVDEQAHALYEASQEAFEDHWGHVPMKYENWQNKTVHRPGFDQTLYFIAWDGDQIAGLSLCRLKPEEVGWVGTLAVRRPWRKQGLGQALLHHSFGEFYRRGLPTVGLGVDAGSLTGATRLYQRVGMNVAKEYVFYQKDLREGREVTEER